MPRLLPESELATVAGGRLAQDKMFVKYVREYEPGFMMPVYLAFRDGGGFACLGYLHGLPSRLTTTLTPGSASTID